MGLIEIFLRKIREKLQYFVYFCRRKSGEIKFPNREHGENPWQYPLL
jgi:hypothetical protein